MSSKTIVRSLFSALAVACALIACLPSNAPVPDAGAAAAVAAPSAPHFGSSAKSTNALIYATPAAGAEAGANVTTSGNSGDLDVSQSDTIQVDFSIVTLDIGDAATGTIQFAWQRKGIDGNYFTVWTSKAFATNTAATGGQTIGRVGTASVVVGDGGLTNTGLGLSGRLTWTLGGSALSSTFSASVQST